MIPASRQLLSIMIIIQTLYMQSLVLSVCMCLHNSETQEDSYKSNNNKPNPPSVLQQLQQTRHDKGNKNNLNFIVLLNVSPQNQSN